MKYGAGAVTAYKAGFAAGAGLVSIGLVLLVALFMVTERHARADRVMR